MAMYRPISFMAQPFLAGRAGGANQVGPVSRWRLIQATGGRALTSGEVFLGLGKF
jgi:hypothetical protein